MRHGVKKFVLVTSIGTGKLTRWVDTLFSLISKHKPPKLEMAIGNKLIPGSSATERRQQQRRTTTACVRCAQAGSAGERKG